jgi:hypothetical protein
MDSGENLPIPGVYRRYPCVEGSNGAEVGRMGHATFFLV